MHFIHTEMHTGKWWWWMTYHTLETTRTFHNKLTTLPLFPDAPVHGTDMTCTPIPLTFTSSDRSISESESVELTGVCSWVEDRAVWGVKSFWSTAAFYLHNNKQHWLRSNNVKQNWEPHSGKTTTTLNIWLLSLCMTTFKTYRIQNHGEEEPL